MRTLVLLVCAFVVSPSVVTSQEVKPSPSAVTLSSIPTPGAQARQSADGKRSRQGIWFNGGLGYGSFRCRGCDGRVGSSSGALALGASLSQKVLLGVGTNVWNMSESGGRLTAGTLGAVIRFYPSANAGFFLLGGLGVGTIYGKRAGTEGESQTGYGTLVGLGYDILVGGNVHLTPFWNRFAGNTDETDFTVGQIGLGLTVH
jgi:hypothetical protein